jgi:C-terminal processing protease CtpA/Prc
VLINGRTASAAECCAYTLQSLGRATIVGQRSAGAANPGERFAIGDGFSVFIPTQAPIDPRTSANWEGTGVVPDHEASGDALQAARELIGSLAAGRQVPEPVPANGPRPALLGLGSGLLGQQRDVQ